MTMPDAEDSTTDDKLMFDEGSDGQSDENLDAYRIFKRKSHDVADVNLEGIVLDFEVQRVRCNIICGRKILPKRSYQRKLSRILRPTLTFYRLLAYSPRWIVRRGELTGNTVKIWHVDRTHLATSTLSLRYSILHKAALSCLVPGSNNTNMSHLMGKVLYVLGSDEQLNIGRVIFDQVIDHAKSHSTLKPIGFSNVPLNPQDAPKPEPTLAPEGEAAGILIKVFEEEQQRLKEKIQSKEARIDELEGKI
ncbi:hypothetical protein LIER_31489 [Lithospermum erythrorhizon]|uniref:Uncharacterized protein n=1 Tax=Lithospermum erythrorhizon TaxID=34254 RepID=A0AAV3RWG4_LITER